MKCYVFGFTSVDRQTSLAAIGLFPLIRFFIYTVNSFTTVGYLLEVFIKLWIPCMVRIFTSAWS